MAKETIKKLIGWTKGLNKKHSKELKILGIGLSVCVGVIFIVGIIFLILFATGALLSTIQLESDSNQN